VLMRVAVRQHVLPVLVQLEGDLAGDQLPGLAVPDVKVGEAYLQRHAGLHERVESPVDVRRGLRWRAERGLRSGGLGHRASRFSRRICSAPARTARASR
jgi:hypothetical protein